MYEQLRAVLFDAVGTLIHPDPPVAKVYFEAGQRLGSNLPEKVIAQRFRAAIEEYHTEELRTDQSVEMQRWRNIVKEVFQDVPDAGGELFESLWSHFATAAHWALYDDVSSTWTTLQKHGLAIGIASNFDDRLSTICSEIDPLARCQHIFWSACVGFAKPHPEFFHTVQQQLGLEPSQILLVGDHPLNDVEGGRLAGWKTVLLDRSKAQADSKSIHSLSHLIGLFD